MIWDTQCDYCGREAQEEEMQVIPGEGFMCDACYATEYEDDHQIDLLRGK